MQQPPPSARAIDAGIPEPIDAVITRCLQPEVGKRYQSARDLLRDLDRIAGGVAPEAPAPRRRPTAWPTVTRRWWVLATVVLVAAAGAWIMYGRWTAPRETPRVSAGPVSTLAVLPFKNASGDPTLDSLGGSVSQVLSTTLGQSSHLRTVPPDRLSQVLQDLQIAPNATLAPAQLASVADFTSARQVLWGTVTRFGSAIRIDATLQDLDRRETIPLNALAANDGQLLKAIGDLADAVREKLARGSADELAELKSTSWKPSTTSLEALRLYGEGVRLTRQGRHQEALKSFEAATTTDPNFALAFSGLGEAYSLLGYDDRAAQASRRAMSLSEGLPPQEKLRVEAAHYRIANDTDQAVAAYEQLLRTSPGDAMMMFDLAGLYEQSGALDKADPYLAKVVELDPKFIPGLLARGRVEIKSGQPQRSLEPLERGLSLATQLENDEARANIQQAIGIAYMRLNRPTEALSRYEESLAIKQRLGDKRGMAASYIQIGEVEKVLGNPEDAEKSYKAALALERDIGDKSGLAITLMDLSTLLDETFGRANEALPLLQEALTITRETGDRSMEARALNNLGATYLARGQYSDAQTYFERALEIRQQAQSPQETADTLHNLGDTFTKMGRYDLALQRYMSALDLRRKSGDARDAALASYGIGTIFDYQGRYGSAVKSKGEALQAFRSLEQQDIWLGEILSGYGSSLSLSGRPADARAPLEEALKLATVLKNPNLTAQTLRYQADRLYYAGDLTGAADMTRRASEAAKSASDAGLKLLARADAAIIGGAVRPTRALAATLADLATEADTRGLKSLSVDCSIARASILIGLGDRAGGRSEVERALAKADALGLKVSLAKAYYLKASVLRATSDPGAPREYAAALRLLEEVKADAGNEHVLERADLSSMHAECVKWARGV